MQSAMHSVVLGHILAGANMDFTGADLLSAWIYQPKPALFAFVFSHVHVERGYVKGQDTQANKNVQVLADRSMPTEDLPL